MARQSRKVMGSLEAARSGFTDWTFYPRGLADVYRLRSAVLRAKPATHREALAAALAAVILRPSRLPLSALSEAALVFYGDSGKDGRKFHGAWREFEEQVWLMEQEPFQDLNLLMKHLGYENGRAHIENALATAGNIRRDVLLGAA